MKQNQRNSNKVIKIPTTSNEIKYNQPQMHEQRKTLIQFIQNHSQLNNMTQSQTKSTKINYQHSKS